jgi:hypothetical protein
VSASDKRTAAILFSLIVAIYILAAILVPCGDGGCTPEEEAQSMSMKEDR